MWWSFLKAIRSGQHRVAPTTWISAAAVVVYAIAPIDLMPELVLGPLGLADDLGVWGMFGLIVLREQRRWLAGLEAD